ncbi:tRNA modification GTPase trmE [Candidatus Magnetoovum chiemensis]|nr:tRNA modification GTPase trmE [Candidatus Magnetoovum chiemensis]
MTINEDTIAAISTPIGLGGLAIVRLSGKEALKIAGRIFKSYKGRPIENIKSFTLTYGHIINKKNETIDEVLISVMRAPHSYTKEDIVEINCHGGMYAVRAALELALKEGARLAHPGEFTLRAFLNGRIDLAQAEAVGDIILAKTNDASAAAMEQLSGRLSKKITALSQDILNICANVEASIDFPEDDIEPSNINTLTDNVKQIITALKTLSDSFTRGKFLREGVSAAIVGRPNVGKSSLLNALVERDKAIVTPLEGTTRDIIEDFLDINGLYVKFMDTAGIRQVFDLAEKEGVNRTLKAIASADLILAVFDAAAPLRDEDREVIKRTILKNVIYILNKSDLECILTKTELNDLINEYSQSVSISNMPSIINVSTKTGIGIDALRECVVSQSIGKCSEPKECVIITNLRHKDAIERASAALEKAAELFIENLPFEIIAIELRNALNSLGEIVGASTTEDILDRIFSSFCIGK